MFIEEIEINLDDELSVGMMLPSTESTYRTYINGFLAFLHLEPVEDLTRIPPEIMIDENVAKFLVHLSHKHDFKPHHKKSAVAAINKINKLLGIPNIHDHAHLWNKTHLILMKWETHLKTRPYFPNQASHYSKEAMICMCDLVSEDTGQIINLAMAIPCCWTSMRAEDITSLLSKHVSRLDASVEFRNPRRWRFYLEKTQK